MKKHLVYDIVILLILAGLITFVGGLLSDEKGCTDQQVEHCMDEVLGNLETCRDEECTCDLLLWFGNTCMRKNIKCSLEKIESVLDQIGWNELKDISCR